MYSSQMLNIWKWTHITIFFNQSKSQTQILGFKLNYAVLFHLFPLLDQIWTFSGLIYSKFLNQPEGQNP